MGCDKELKDLDYNNFDDAKEIVLRFKDEYLQGNIENLANFSFWTIAGNPNYDGTCIPTTLEKFDGDRTRIVYAIERIIYNESLFSKNSVFSLGNNLTGDTINTFRTVFGNRFSCWGNKEIEVEEKFNFDSNLKQNRNNYFFIYQKLGNFYLLPSRTVRRQSINKYRNYRWFDFSDLFFKELETRIPLKKSPTKTDYFQKLLNKNDFFFDAKMGFDNFLKIFYLDDYKTLSFNHISGEKLVHWWSKNLTADEYKDFALDYISKATELINKRSKILVDELKKII